jgi:hypothetical protein
MNYSLITDIFACIFAAIMIVVAILLLVASSKESK